MDLISFIHEKDSKEDNDSFYYASMLETKLFFYQ